MLGAAPKSLAAVEAAKSAALADVNATRGAAAGSSADAGEEGVPTDRETAAGGGTVPPASLATAFQVGELVALRSDPGIVVPILEVVPGGAETRYHVKGTYVTAEFLSSLEIDVFEVAPGHFVHVEQHRSGIDRS